MTTEVTRGMHEVCAFSIYCIQLPPTTTGRDVQSADKLSVN